MAQSSRIDKIIQLIAPDFSDALLQWDRYLRNEKVVSKHTIRAYQTDLQHFVQFLSQHLGGSPSLNALSEVALQDFRGWLARKAGEGASARSRARALSGIKNFLSFLDKRGIMHHASVSLLGTPKIPKTLPKAISQNQAKELIDLSVFEEASDFTERRNQMIFLLLYGCGLRISEALDLNIGDIPGNDGFWRIMGKGRKERLVPTLPIITKTLEKYLCEHPYSEERESPLFIGVKGKRLNQGMAQKALRQIRVSYGFPETLTPHALRHSYATHLLAEGANLREIQELLGHASLSSTQIYTDVENSQLMDIHKKTHPSNKKRNGASGQS